MHVKFRKNMEYDRLATYTRNEDDFELDHFSTQLNVAMVHK